MHKKSCVSERWFISVNDWQMYWAELGLMGPCGTDARLHLHCGREQSLWILVTRGVQCGVEGRRARAWMEPYLSIENPVCLALARQCMGPYSSSIVPHYACFLRPSSITRHLAGYFVLLVWCIMQIIVTKYSITDLGLQSSTLIVEAEQWWWLIGAGWSSNDDINIWRHLTINRFGCIYLACVGAEAIYVYRV
jgi:hypothetical protein